MMQDEIFPKFLKLQHFCMWHEDEESQRNIKCLFLAVVILRYETLQNYVKSPNESNSEI